jgi:hypothetical protein
MGHGTVIIGIDEEGEKVLSILREKYKDDPSKEWLTIHFQREGEAGAFLLKGDTPFEIKNNFLSRRMDFLSLLGSYYKSIQVKTLSAESLRYLLLCPLNSTLGISLPVEVAKVIRHFHEEVVSSPCEIEMSLILPSLHAEGRIKGLSYAALKEINYLQSSSRDGPGLKRDLFGFVFFCSEHKSLFLPSALSTYLETNVQNDFNTNARSNVLTGSFLGENSAYSSLGTFYLTFSCEEMIEFLRNMLEADILSSGPLKIQQMERPEIEALVKDFEGKLKGYKLEEKRLALKEKKIEINVDFFLMEFEKEDGKSIDFLIDDIYRRADILFERGKEKVVDTDIKNWQEEYSTQVRKDAEEFMDHRDRGIFVGTAFLSFVLGDEGFYRKIAKPPLPDIKNLYNLYTILVLPIKEEALAILKADLDEVIGRLSAIYRKYEIPSIIWKGVERTQLEAQLDTEATIDCSTFSEEDRTKVNMLRSIREIILFAMEEIDKLLAEAERWNVIFKSLEAFTREKAREKLAELKSIREQMERARAELGAHRLKRMPLLFGRKRYKRKLKELTAVYESLVKRYEEEKKVFSSIIIERKNFIFQQRLILELYNKLMKATSLIKGEIEGFVDALKKRKGDALEWVNSPHFVDDEITFNVAKAEHAKFFYPAERELPTLINSFYSFLHKTNEPKSSLHYREGKHFIENLGLFCLSQFQRLKELSIEEVMFKLDNYKEALTRMTAECKTFAHIETYPGDLVSTMLYIGVEDENKTRLKKEGSLNSIQGSYQFYSNGEKHLIAGLRIAHGFTLFALKGIQDLKNSYKKLLVEGEESLKEYGKYDDLIPEELKQRTN